LELKEILPTSSTPVAQKAVLESVVTEDRRSALCVLALDARILVQPIANLMSRGIPVILLGDDAPQSRRSVFIGADERAIGETIGKTLVGLCKPRRTLMVVHDNRGDARSALRHQGMREELALHPEVRILRDFDCLGQRAKALKLMYDTSERYPNLGGWALLGEWLGGGHLADRPLVHGSAKIVSVGAHAGHLALVEDGRVHALVGVDWEALGFRAAEACHQLLTDSLLPTLDYEAPPIVVSSENVAEYRAKWQVTSSAPSSAPARR
jgi:ribose transport system substrate-binding protein